MRINHNISALMANNQLKKTNKALDRSLEKLSSGYRINRAADDAAGLAISQKMKTQIAGLEQASRNAADGISVIQTAEGALSEVEAMLQRMRELSVQAANGTNTNEDRKAIQAEVEQLKAEIQRISDDTEFNTKNLLNGSLDRRSYSNNTKVKIISLSDVVPTKDYNVVVTAKGAPATAVAGAAVNHANILATTGKITINGNDLSVEAGDPIAVTMEKLRNLCDSINVDVSTTNSVAITDPAAILAFSSKESGTSQSITISGDPALLNALGLSAPTITGGVDASINITGGASGFSSTATVIAEGDTVTITDSDGFQMKLYITPDITLPAQANAQLKVLDAGTLLLQIGANEGQLVDVRIPEVSPLTLGINNINLTTDDGAQKGITLLDKAINQVSSIRAKLGAYQNRMEHAIANLDTGAENLTEALSRVEDVDMAEEMATYTQKNVLAQAGTSMLAQANQRPQMILSLLQG